MTDTAGVTQLPAAQPSPSPSEEKLDAFADESQSYSTSLSGARSLFVDGIRINVDPSVPKLADGEEEKRWSWLDLFRFGKAHKRTITNWNAVATRPSVYDDPVLAPHYTPMYVLLSYCFIQRG